MNVLEIKKFLILSSITVRYTDVLVIIGPQAEGKSLISKLLYFFENIEKEFYSNIIANNSKPTFQKELQNKFLKIFNMENLVNNEINITFKNDNFTCLISKVSTKSRIVVDFDEGFWSKYKSIKLTFNKCNKIKEEYKFPKFYEVFQDRLNRKINLSDFIENFSEYYVTSKKTINQNEYSIDKIKQKLEHSMEFDKNYLNQSMAVYVPAGRSFFANLQKSIFNFLTNNLPIDYFLKEFGAKYERMKFGCTESRDEFFYSNLIKSRFENSSMTILGGNYVRFKDRDYIKSKSGSLVNLEYASSGQQEALPLLLSIVGTVNNTTLIIEEPEAHLFPSAQAEVVKLIGQTYNATEASSNYIITTHSPYILLVINNSLHVYIAKKIIIK